MIKNNPEDPKRIEGEIVESEQGYREPEQPEEFRLHNLDGPRRSYVLRWQLGCLGCLIPVTIIFLLGFFMFRIGTGIFGN